MSIRSFSAHVSPHVQPIYDAAEASSYFVWSNRCFHSLYFVCPVNSSRLQAPLLVPPRGHSGGVCMWHLCLRIHVPFCAMLHQALWVRNPPRGTDQAHEPAGAGELYPSSSLSSAVLAKVAWQGFLPIIAVML